MKLVRMHIQGFKSFKDRTTIHFDKGITGIVGPNGCGKSNIVDALFWVMGEQSAKHLRGKSMKDLIFSGSSKYNPGSWAEVTLVLENDTGKHIHIMNQVSKPAEIALTRKLYRNGDTEYRINNIPARLKDIQEVFMDTGAGAKSYSIIAQGEINRLVQAKPEERRVMIEEVAGITKFKLRKRDSLKKIEHTQANLSRLEDLQTEIYKNLKSLERQAEKAEKARTLKDRIKRHELIKESHKEHDFLKDFKEGKSLLVEKETILEESTLKREALELTLEDERNKKVDIMEKVNTAQEEFNELSKLLAAAEERLNYLKKSGGEKEKYIEEKVHENTEIQNDLGSRTTRHEEISNQVEVLESSNPEDADFSEMEERVELLKENLRDKEDALNLLKSELEEAKDRFSDIDQREFKNTSKLEEFASSLQDINAEIESLEEHSSNFTDELTSQREQLRLSTTKKEELKGLVTESKEKVISLEAEHKDLDANIRTFSREVITLESKRESLISINDTEDVSEGANQFLEQVEGNTFNLMGKLIESEPEYGTALEALFGEHFESMISNDGIFDSLIDWNKDNNNNLLAWDLISVNNSDSTYTETAERLEVRGCSNILAVNEIVKVNESGFRSQLSQFFNGFFVVDNLTGELALKVSKDISFKGIVSKDGSIFVRKTDGNFKISVRNSDDAGQGVVQRNNLINELTESLEVKEVDLRNMETRFTELCNEREQVKLNFETQNAEYIETNNNFIKLKTSLESKESNFKTSFSRLEILNNRKSEISTTRLDLLEIEDQFLTEKEDLQVLLDDKTEALDEVQTSTEDLRMVYEEERDQLVSLQASAKTYESQLKNLRSQIEDVDTQIERYNEKLENNNSQQEQLTLEIEGIEISIEEVTESNMDQANVLTEKEDSLGYIKDDLSELLVNMQERETEVKNLTQVSNKADKSIVEIELKLEKIVEDEEILTKNIFEKYQIDLRQNLAKYLEVGEGLLTQLNDVSSMFLMETENGEKEIERAEYEFEKRFPAQVKESRDKYKQYKSDLNRLGEINWQAIEDYERQKLRHEFLKVQELELKSSLQDLENAISHIDEKCKVRFKDAFEEVNLRFTKVFPIIFGGGEARLEVTGDLNTTEAGIEIIAQPPGKKMQNINLMSGGEKAMTAVSLIFSIFLVKPSPFCLLDEVDAPLDDANVGRFNELLREMSSESQFILITHNKKTMELNDTLYGVTMQEPGVSKAVSVQLH